MAGIQSPNGRFIIVFISTKNLPIIKGRKWKSTIYRWCSQLETSICNAWSHIFPYFPICSHIFPYVPIFSHIFPIKSWHSSWGLSSHNHDSGSFFHVLWQLHQELPRLVRQGPATAEAADGIGRRLKGTLHGGHGGHATAAAGHGHRHLGLKFDEWGWT